ncbi:MAG: D-alanyl-D-alanine carboxypeptidase [Alphaproteobacteria bacterium]|nr:D-alanyl-D-alanine carboxypeptidase [Alphaproteobacteria bacterium]
MKRFFILYSLFFILSVSAFAADYNAVLVADLDTGKVLYSENANDLNYPASLTKIMTLYLTFDALEHKRLNLDDHLIVSQSAANALPVKLGLAAGSKIRVEDAIKAVAVHSANDVARVLAENLKGGKEGNFASLMTQVATEIGLSKTNFENSSGLPDDDHLSSARDIALLSMAVYKHFPQYWKYFGIQSWTYNGQTYTNGNRLLASYPGCDGMKTGYTNKSKYSLVATAKRDGRRVMSVVLGAQTKDIRAAVSTRMLDKGFTILGTGAAPVAVQNNYAPPPVAVTKPLSKPAAIVPVQNAGGTGVQFGAFGSRAAAESQVTRVRNITGLSAVVEPSPSGMFRVRANGLSESAAQSACQAAKTQQIDCFVFH